jgi:PKD repeat protein
MRQKPEFKDTLPDIARENGAGSSAFAVRSNRLVSAARPRAGILLALFLITAVIATVTGSGSVFAQQAGAFNWGATGAASGKIPVREPPTLALEAVPAYGYAPLTVGFVLSAVDPQEVGFVSYNWDFGDGHVSTLPPTLTYNTYTKAGTYVVRVTAVTADGRFASAFTGIVVKPPKLR